MFFIKKIEKTTAYELCKIDSNNFFQKTHFAQPLFRECYFLKNANSQSFKYLIHLSEFKVLSMKFLTKELKLVNVLRAFMSYSISFQYVNKKYESLLLICY